MNSEGGYEVHSVERHAVKIQESDYIPPDYIPVVLGLGGVWSGRGGGDGGGGRFDPELLGGELLFRADHLCSRQKQ